MLWQQNNTQVGSQLLTTVLCNNPKTLKSLFIVFGKKKNKTMDWLLLLLPLAEA